MSREPKKPPSKPDAQPLELGDIEAEITKRIGALVSREQKDQIVSQVIGVVREEHFSGPIAHPRHLREYEEILPGAADRIIGMAERNLTHKQELESKALSADIDDQRLGQKFGFAALIALVIAAAVSAYFSNNVAAGLFLGTGALGTIGVFVKGRMNGNGS